eukprot:CAMPEP_0113525874 /NCGR_PEP_ID=MMETSP0015_2-20120614/422_1 /TAXON_ID=2838 /ORGANISM="Odontella" /LENGTH=216 /DNA_ID=CAMNT_0000424125 /DNA_START=13 /DNA_END=663 /DNA_ORIENTATION=- /assembly_acc=CAM_ASM_000160
MATSQESQPLDAIAEFQAGVTAALRSWHPLRTAVEGDWGGVESKAKADDLRGNIFHHFDGSQSSPKLSLEELEENLTLYMEEEFSIVLEDGSERQVADMIWRMYETCARGDFSVARQVVANVEKVVASQATQRVIVHDDEEMCDEDHVVGVQSSESAQAYAAESVFGAPLPQQAADLPPARQLGEPEPEKPAIQLDDDGFAPVQKRKSRRSKVGPS